MTDARSIITRTLTALIAAVAIALQMGCEDSFVDPFDNEQRYYTVYGYLDEGKNRQIRVPHEIRVIPVTRFPERITSPLNPQADLDAKVFSRDMTAEEDTTIEWTHALEQLSDGLFAHIFRAEFYVEAGHTYRLEVLRSDGATAWAETTVPLLSNVVPVPTDLRVVDDSTTILQDIVFPGQISPWDITVSYDVGGRDCTLDRGVTTPLRYGRVGQSTGDGWRFTVNISDDIDRLSDRLEVGNVFFCAMGVRVQALDPNWVIPVDADPEALALPTAYTNVHNGYGFFGSVGSLQHEWAASSELLLLIEDRGR
ncbi:MAG: hypothetical protein R2834_19975 [Rhodothermales bacterium]